MARAEYRVYFDNVPATAAQLASISEIRIDQGIGMAAAAELELPIATSDAGSNAGHGRRQHSSHLPGVSRPGRVPSSTS